MYIGEIGVKSMLFRACDVSDQGLNSRSEGTCWLEVKVRRSLMLCYSLVFFSLHFSRFFLLKFSQMPVSLSLRVVWLSSGYSFCSELNALPQSFFLERKVHKSFTSNGSSNENSRKRLFVRTVSVLDWELR